MVFGFTAQRQEQVKHILTGRFDSEAELAGCRSEIIGENFPDLTTKELEVITLLLQGRNTPGIAAALVVSENTVKTHIQHIYRKLRIRSRQELLHLAEEIPYEPKTRSA
jgi:LuxR family transcriptional regulator of csgAB operon